MTSEVEFSGNAHAAASGGPGVSLLSMDAAWEFPPIGGGGWPSFMTVPSGDWDQENFHFAEIGLYVVRATLAVSVVLPERDDPRLLKLNNVLTYGMDWGGTGG